HERPGCGIEDRHLLIRQRREDPDPPAQLRVFQQVRDLVVLDLAPPREDERQAGMVGYQGTEGAQERRHVFESFLRPDVEEELVDPQTLPQRRHAVGFYRTKMAVDAGMDDAQLAS